jgi:hypothetical protein
VLCECFDRLVTALFRHVASSSTDCGADRLTEMQLLLTIAETSQKAALAVSMCATLVTDDGPSTAGGEFSVNPLAPKVTRLANLVSAHGSVFNRSLASFSQNGSAFASELYLL